MSRQPVTLITSVDHGHSAGSWGQSTATPFLGHDQSPNSAPALETAADLAVRLRAHLHVVHGIDLTDYPLDPDGPEWEEHAQRAVATQHRQVAETLTARKAPIDWTYHAAHGDPVTLLTTVADETSALMIIVGSRGEGPKTVFSRMFDPSVSHGLLARQHRPVLVVPDAAAKRHV